MDRPAAVDTLSVVFTDLVGSTELRVRLGDEAADTLRHVHDALLTEQIRGRDGTIVKGLGDGFLATFRSAAEAVAASIAIHQAVDAHSRVHPERSFEVRIGASVGDVSVEDGDVFGTPVVEAARLCDVAAPGEILAADLVRALSRGRSHVVFESMGELELKGLPEPLSACRVVWEPLAEPDRDDAVPLPGLLVGGSTTSYVGREALLARLGQGWSHARSGGCATILLSGEPGVGKTRTAAEAARAAHRQGAVVLYGRCDEDLGAPYQPFTEALDHYTMHANPPLLGRFAGELARLLPEISQRVRGLPDAVSSDPRSEEHRLFEAVASWLCETSGPHGLVLVLDDLHWASKPALGLLLHILRAATSEGSAARMLVIGTYRDTDVDRSHPLSSTLGELRRLTGVDRLPVEGLTASELEAFVQAAAGQELDDDGRRLASILHAETEGNPFFAGEVLRHLVETGGVRREGTRWVVGDPDHIMIPEGVRDVVGRRLSVLSGDANQVLSIAAVVGREVDVDVLLALADVSEGDVLDSLDEALRARLVEEVAPDRFRFAHALVRTTLYDELSATRRRRLHRRVAEALEKLHPDDVAALAYHCVEGGPEGGDHSRAIHYSLAAAHQALEGRAPADAEHRYRQALELIDDSPAIDLSQRVDALLGLGEAQRNQGDPSFRETLLEAGAQARALGDRGRLVHAVLSNHRGTVSLVGDTDDDRLELAQAALATIGEDPTPQRAMLAAHLAVELAFAGDAMQRRRFAREAEAIAEQVGEPGLRAWVAARIGLANVSPDTWLELPGRMAEASRAADAAGDPSLRVQTMLWESSSLLTLGEFLRARDLRAQAAELARREADPLLVWIATSQQVCFDVIAGRLAEASAKNLECLQVGQHHGAPDADNWWNSIEALISWGRDTPGAIADLVAPFADQYPKLPEWRTTQIWLLCDGGRYEEARRVLETHPMHLDDLLNGLFPFLCLTHLCEVSYWLRDTEMAAGVEVLLQPYADACSHYHVGIMGLVATGLGRCAHTRGNLDEAIAYHDGALRRLESPDVGFLRLLSATPMIDALATRRRPDDLERAADLAAQSREQAHAFGALGCVQRIDTAASRI